MSVLKKGLLSFCVSIVVGVTSPFAKGDASAPAIEVDASAKAIVSQIADLNSFQIGITCPPKALTVRCALAVVASQESKDAFKTLFLKGLVINDLTIYPITLTEWLLDAAISIGN
jgi:energy-converting hydrogenase Eha subunit H